MFRGEQLGAALTPIPTTLLAPSFGALSTMAPDHTEALRLLTPQEIRASMSANARIPIANGFQLAPDYRPAGQEDAYIPQEVFTWYFSNGIVPYASSGEHQAHDRRHGPSYYRLFQSPSFASCVREAAGASYKFGRSFYFTKAMDTLGDSHVLLTTCEKPDAASDYEHVVDARLYLRRLIQLRESEYPRTDTPLDWKQSQLFGSIWFETGFADLEAQAENQLEELPAHEKEAIVRLYG